MDEFMEYSAELDTVLECYEDDTSAMSLADFVYEEGDEDDTKDKVDSAKNTTNVELQNKSMNLLQKMIAAVKSILNKAKDAIKNAIEYLKAPGDEKASYEEFLEKARTDPNLKDKKITFTDYRKIIQDYDTECGKYEAEYKKFVESQAEDNPSLFKTAKEKLDALGINAAHVAEAGAASFRVEQMIIMAQSSRKHAEETAKKLNLNILELKALEAELGKPEVQKLKRKLKMLQSRCTFIRMLAGGRNDQSMTELKAADEIKNSLWRLFKVEQRAERSKHGEDVKNARGYLLKQAPKFIKANKQANKWAENEEKAAVEGEKNRKYDIKQQEQYEKRQQKKQDKLDKTAQDNAKAIHDEKSDAEDFQKQYDDNGGDAGRKLSRYERRKMEKERKNKQSDGNGRKSDNDKDVSN